MKLKPTCREVHQLVSEGMDRELTFVERARMRFHLLMCGACTTFIRQMGFLRGAMQHFEIPADAPADPVKPAPAPPPREPE
ncbi:zf-HC2 domain-containing protein [Actimicrobium antarcticum]|uniref:Putative zinc-finger domain-containing protein n=1 Tax=Actimicrobium antarcticum TaxID=1051899 RepID=A0ABP7T4E2_9BURK